MHTGALFLAAAIITITVNDISTIIRTMIRNDLSQIQ